MLLSYPPFVLLIITLTANLLCTVFRSLYCKRVDEGIGSIFVYSAITGVVCAIILTFFGGFTLDISLFTLLTSIGFGIVTTTTTIFHLLALSTGPLSLTTVIMSFSMVINALSGAIFWGEKLSALKIIGIALMFLCFILTVRTKQSDSIVSIKWFVFAVLCSISNAAIGLLQKTHQSSQYKGELMPFLVISFVASAVISFVIYLITNARKSKKKTKFNAKPLVVLIVILLVSGVCIALNNVLCLHLSGVMDSAIFFPVNNGAALILSILAGVVLFRERLPLRCWIGVAFGTAATLCLCI